MEYRNNVVHKMGRQESFEPNYDELENYYLKKIKSTFYSFSRQKILELLQNRDPVHKKHAYLTTIIVLLLLSQTVILKTPLILLHYSYKMFY